MRPIGVAFFSGSSHSFGPGALLTSPARPVPWAWSRSNRLCSSRCRARSRCDRLDSSRRPGLEQRVPLWLVLSTGPGADSLGSFRHPGPEPYRPQWLDPLLRARSRLSPPRPPWLVPSPGPEPPLPLWLVPSPGPGADSLGSSRRQGPEPLRPLWLVPLLRARSGVDCFGSSRSPGPEPPRPLWLVPFPGPEADRIGSSRHPGPEPPRQHWLVPFPWPCQEPYRRPATFALGPWSPFGWPLLCAGPRPCH